ncbi:proliferation marker protein Ki-67 isoform X2 [Triplophysa dalaica]|uniref:proliferation marker protein Ki-67 isoform X2 n=1 Tax=Triplophysa dalaica TaxID=1582913 RepID=UPI0024DFBCDE|nr:proliferation marker protein Ki-67 isoform X2 [Triplophysa dalaica]
MPLLGKIVVIKRNGEDGTEFPLTASCLFGRKLNCDIRIQLPQVSKEHCRIELNENKELILTNLSSVNPTLINGEALQEIERLKHGDLITIIDRSFRFEYPPPKTPKKKRLSTTGQDKTPQLEKSTPVPVEKRKSEHSFDTCLKDGSNLPQSLEQTVETAADEKPKKDSMSPFGELYQMVKQDLAAKSPWKSGLAKTPLARPQVDQVPTSDVKNNPKPVTAPSTKRRRSSKGNFEDQTGVYVPQSSTNATPEGEPAEMPSVESSTPLVLEKSGTPVSQKNGTPSKTPETFSAGEVVQQILPEPQPEEKTPRSPKRRRSGASQDQSLALQISSSQPPTPGPEEKNTDVKMSPRTSPRANAGKRFQVQDVLSEITADTHTDVAIRQSKKKRVSFGGQLSPELFDKCMPPNSPLHRGATPRRSLGPSQKPLSLLRRASTIGLLALRLEETDRESAKAQSSPAKKASPKRAATKTPSPAKRSPRAKTPSQKPQKSPSGAATASPKTPASSRRSSSSSIEAAGNGSAIETPKVQGRFSVSRISTPSPVQDQMDEGEDMPQVSGTPAIPLRRKSMKSARKTPKSAMTSALNVMRSRRSGASRANLKVLNSWADIVKFGQSKPQTDVTTKKTTKSVVVKRTVVPKPKTPARRLKEDISTGHAMSPVTLVVGRAHLRTNLSVGTAPKIVPNIAVLKKDMKMDEDLTGIADIFKTPANKSKNMARMNSACPETPLEDFSVMKTPEESGEMMVSPLSMVSTAKRENYKNEAVTRLLLDNQEDSLLNEDRLLQPADNSNDAQESVEMAESDQTEEAESVPKVVVKTPKQAAVPSLCLTGVKRLMKTPRQRAEPIEDLRGKLLKTPKAPKYPQEESLEGVKELLKTPKHGGVVVEDMVGEIKRLTQTPKENNPVLFADGNEDITAVKELMKTPKVMEEEDLNGLKQLMKTPKHKGEPVENHLGLKRLMQTPKEKVEPLEDLTGVKQLMKTPKHKGEPVGNQLGVSKLQKTPRQNGAAAEEEFTGLKEIVEEPESSSTQNKFTESFETLEPVPVVANDDASMPAKDFDMECDKENVCPVEPMETEVFKSVDLPCTTEAFDSQLKIESVAVVPQEEHCDQTKEESVSVQDIDVCSSEVDEKTKEQTEETTSENSGVTAESTQHSRTAEQEEEEAIKPSLASKPQQGSRGRAAQKSKAPAVLSIIEESAPPPPSPGRGRRGKQLIEVTDVAASPLRKSARGRVSKPSFEVEEVKNTEAVQAPVASMKTEVSDSQPEIAKTKNGRKAQKDDAEIEPVEDASALAVQCSDVPAPTGKEERVQATVPKAGRRRMNKMESQPSEEPQQITETVSEENAVTTGSVSLQTSEVAEALVTATRARRGRPQKKENVKTEPTPSLESDMTSTPVDVVAEKPPAKSGRGRTSKKETIKDQTVDDEPKFEAAVDSQDKPEAPVVKSVRGRRAKQQKPQMAEDVDIQSVADASTHATVTEEYPEIEVKSVRNGRRAKQISKQIPVEAEENVVSVAEQAKVPVVKATRRRPIAKEVESVADVPVKRGRRAALDPTPPVAVVSGRGRKAAVKAELEVTEDVASSEEQVKSIKQTRRTAKVPESKKVSSESVADENTVPDKVGRATRGKKEKGSTKDTAKTQMNDSVTPEEDTVTKSSKTVNWSPALGTSKEIEDFETSTDVKEAPLKRSKKLDKLSAKTMCTESDQSADQPLRGRRGRGARKEEEASVEDLPEEPQMKAKPVRRGKAAASAAPKAEPKDIKASTPLKRKRNEPLEVTEDPRDKEPLPKRRGRVANSTEVVSSKEKTLEPEPTPKKTSKRTTRGQNKKLQEPDPAPVPAQESVSGTRKARGVKKAEAADISIEAAPLRRTRRK